MSTNSHSTENHDALFQAYQRALHTVQLIQQALDQITPHTPQWDTKQREHSNAKDAADRAWRAYERAKYGSSH